MGNLTNPEQWAARERLRFIERQAWWRAMVNRSDLQELFGISAAQASSDLQTYQEANPTALTYNLKTKRYEARPEMVCGFHVPHLEEAFALFYGDTLATVSVGESPQITRITLPAREPEPQVARRVFLAVHHGRRIWLKYWSIHRKRMLRREIAPHAFGHDGYRWHARAWCFENQEYRDFVLSRMEEAEWPVEPWKPPAPDTDWNRFEEILVRPWRGLTEDQRAAIRRDYCIRGETLRLRVRGALKSYLLAHLRIENDVAAPRHLELVEPESSLKKDF